jgi:CheY-like chemotaxis protein
MMILSDATMESECFKNGCGNMHPAGNSSQRVGRILVLDDENSIAEMLCEMLSLEGHRTTLSNCAKQALELVGVQDFDVIISDVRMPGMNGRQFYEALRESKPDLAQRVAFLTGGMLCDDTQEFLESTGNPLLPKPFQLDEVSQMVSDMLRPGE